MYRQEEKENPDLPKGVVFVAEHEESLLLKHGLLAGRILSRRGQKLNLLLLENGEITGYAYEPTFDSAGNRVNEDEALNAFIRLDNYKEVYDSDVVYALITDIGHDYEREMLVQDIKEQVQFNRRIALFKDEVGTLIREATTPMILSAREKKESAEISRMQEKADELAYGIRNTPSFYERNENTGLINLTREGFNWLNRQNGLEAKLDRWREFIETALYAYLSLTINDHYRIDEGGYIRIIEKTTGRDLGQGREWSYGVKQAVELKAMRLGEHANVQRSPQRDISAWMDIKSYLTRLDFWAGTTGAKIKGTPDETAFQLLFGKKVEAVDMGGFTLKKDIQPTQIYRAKEQARGEALKYILEYQIQHNKVPAIIIAESDKVAAELKAVLSARGYTAQSMISSDEA